MFLGVPKNLKYLKNLKNLTNMTFPNRGEGVPDLGKIPTFSRFFGGGDVPK